MNPEDNLPADAGELNLNWLNAVLQTTPEIVGFDAETIGIGSGFAGSLARVTLRYGSSHEAEMIGETEGGQPSHGTPHSVVVKFAATDPAVRVVLDSYGGYEREHRFYLDIAPATRVSMPHCYFTHIANPNVAPAGQQDSRAADAGAQGIGVSVVVMQDLTQGRIGDQVTGATVAETEAVFVQLAALHARWWNDPALDGLDWAQPLENSIPREKLSDDYTNALAYFRTTFNAQYPYIVSCAEAIAGLMGDPLPPPRPYTFTQGDCRQDNVFYSEGEGEGGSIDATLFDWQLAGVAGPVSDITRFLTQSVSRATREAHEATLLRFYLSQLEEHGISHPFRRFRLEYKLEMIRQLVSWVIANDALDFTGTSDRAVALQFAVIERLDAALRAHKVMGLIRIGRWILRLLRLVAWVRRDSRG